MPADLTIQGIASLPATTAAAQFERPPTVPAPEASTRSGAPRPSPVEYLDHSIGIVVLAFFDGSGKEVSSIPSQKQLDAFRQSEQMMASSRVAGPSGAQAGPPAATVDGGTPRPQPSGKLEGTSWPPTG